MSSIDKNPIIYHVFIDRFAVSPTANNDSRNCPTQGENSSGTFYGGTFAGATDLIDSEWFCQLGINIILISAPYEQIRGWVPGADNKFKHYGYHGYYALDYTVIDQRFGTEDDLQALVNKAHKKGISVLIDIVMNHPGYLDYQTLHECGIDAMHDGWERATPENFEYYLNRDSPALKDWWGHDWVRCDLPGYSSGGDNDCTMLLHKLPDFKTESSDFVALPTFLRNKKHTKAIDRSEMTVRGYLIEWLTDWVRIYGIDGFRCDSAKHVEPEAWLELKHAALQAKREWWERQHDKCDIHSDFWMLGEVFGHGVERSHYFDYGFDSLINFDFQKDYEFGIAIDLLYENYAARLYEYPDMDFVSYISSHDTHLFDRHKIREGCTALMLAPGGVLLLYGDESSRLPGPVIEEDLSQATRSLMNWDSVDTENLAHWRRLIRFRTRHGAIARGIHLKLQDCPYVFARVDASGDRVVASLQVDGDQLLPVGEIFGEGEKVRDAYSGWRGVVKGDHVRLFAQGVVLLESDDGAFPDWDAASEERIHP